MEILSAPFAVNCYTCVPNDTQMFVHICQAPCMEKYSLIRFLFHIFNDVDTVELEKNYFFFLLLPFKKRSVNTHIGKFVDELDLYTYSHIHSSIHRFLFFFTLLIFKAQHDVDIFITKYDKMDQQISCRRLQFHIHTVQYVSFRYPKYFYNIHLV